MANNKKKNVAITVKNLHITYRGLKKTSIRASWKNFGSKIELFHALKGVSFEVEEGKILGIIGKNGSGKSTMLRAIAGIFSPDKGTIDLHGRSISLLSIGVGFNKKLTGTIHLAPFGFNWKYVDRLELSTRNGIDEGRHSLSDFGSEFTVDLTWALSDMVKWKTRMYGYTTYNRTEFDWENQISLQFNRYISANIFLYPRFDDGGTRDTDYGYWEFKEYCSLGFSYSF